jgi:hypothetical protein
MARRDTTPTQYRVRVYRDGFRLDVKTQKHGWNCLTRAKVSRAELDTLLDEKRALHATYGIQVVEVDLTDLTE